MKTHCRNSCHATSRN